MINLKAVGHFTWGFSDEFFIEANEGNFIWFDPEYGGNNTIKSYAGNYKDWCKELEIPFGRDKGNHIIENYVGLDVKVLD